MYDFHLIVNPRSLRSSVRNSLYQNLLSYLKAQGWSYHLATSSSAEELTVLTRAALVSGARKILPIGGDGTLSLCARAFFAGAENRFPESLLVPMPFGTGHDFYQAWMRSVRSKSWNWLHPEMPSERISVGHYRDAGGQEGYVLNSLSLGISASILAARNALPLLQGHPLAYLLAAVRELMHYRSRPLQIEVAGDTPERRETLLFLVCKGPLVGGGMRFLSGIDPCASQAEAVWVPRLKASFVLRSLPKLYQGHVDQVGGVRHLSFEQLRIHRDSEELEVEIDGELVYLQGPLDLSILPSVLAMAKPYWGT